MPFTAQLAGLAGVPAALAKFGVPAGPLLAKVGLTLQDLQSIDRRVRASVADDLLGLCVEATECAHFGLLAGACGPGLGGAGSIGLAALAAPTVGAALADLEVRTRFFDPMFTLACAVHGRDAVFSCELQATELEHCDQLYDIVLAMMRTGMRELCWPTWVPEIVYLPRRRPRELQPYREALGPHLKFDALRACLIFPAALLAVPVAASDPARRRNALQQARLTATKSEPPLFADVRRAIRTSMELGDCSRAEVSRRLGLHERAFCRRLHANGRTFQEILEETRFSIARELLCFTRMPVGRIAVALGYQNSTVFGRAFRRWAGARPTEFREEWLRRHTNGAAEPPQVPVRSGDVPTESAA